MVLNWTTKSLSKWNSIYNIFSKASAFEHNIPMKGNKANN